MKAMIAELYAAERQTGSEDAVEGALRTRNQIIKRFVQIGKPATPVLLDALNDNTRYGFVRRSAAEAIGKIHDPASVPSLHWLLKNGNSSQRQGAAEALGNLKSRQSTRQLIKALSGDSQWEVRFLTAIALGQIGNRSAITPLFERFRDRKENGNVRSYAVLALSGLQATSKIHAILIVLEEENHKAPGGFLAVNCDHALRGLTNAPVTPYYTTHIKQETRDKSVAEWQSWWAAKARFEFPQS